jgi:hypothetical protein
MNSSSFFTPCEMRSIAKKNPLQWANDYLFQHIMAYSYDFKDLILKALENSKSAVLFRFTTVHWNHTLHDEKELLKLMTREERDMYRALKTEKKIEIADKGYEHYVMTHGQKASIRSVLQHTDLMNRLNAEFGPEFVIVQTQEKKCGTYNFMDSNPHYMVLDCTISLEYKPSWFTKRDIERVLKAVEKARDYYTGYKTPFDMDTIYLLNEPLARHLKFEEDD